MRFILTLFLLLGTWSIALADDENTNSTSEVVEVQEQNTNADIGAPLSAEAPVAPTEEKLTRPQVDQIAELDKQRKAGTLTQEEYDLQKQKLLVAPVEEATALRVGEVIDPTAQTLGKYIATQVSATDGSLNYEYPIIVPLGRNDLTPDLKLAYNSSNKSLSSVIAVGWSFNIPYIQRVNKKGSDQLYTQNDFLSSLDGELVNQGGGIYKPRTENGTFLKYQYVNSTWIVTDKTGTKYVFGSTTQARQDDPGNSAKIFTWMLEKVTDTNGNTISYTYYKDQGQIYPDNIKYNQENTFEVRFNRIARSYATFSYFSAFQVKTAYLINQIDVFVSGVQSSKYVVTSSNNQLDSIVLTGYEAGTAASLPATTFAYSSSSITWNSTADQTVTTGDVRSRLLIDINGDGLTDIVNSYRGTGPWPAAVNNTTYINTGSGFISSSSFAIPTSYWLNSQSYGTNIAIADMNGDGLPDLVTLPSASNLRSIYLNTGSGWGSLYAQIPYSNTYLPNTQLLVDVNGDGLTDAVSAYYVQAGGPQNATYLNTGSGFSYSSSFTMPSSYSLNGESGTVPNITLADMNGDGLLDLVQIPSGSNVSQVAYAFLNNGNGWASTEWVVDTWPLGIPTPTPRDRNLFEVSGDGLTDVVNSSCSAFGGAAGNATNLYAGTSYVGSSQHTLPSTICISSTNQNENASLADMNGDSLVDIVKAPALGTVAASNVYFNKGAVLSTLALVTSPEGGTFKINYVNAAFQDQSNKSPTLNQVVASIITNDNNGVIATTSYAYKNGAYYFNSTLDRRFAGFGEITKTNADGSKVTTKYHQANGQTGDEPLDSYAKIGKAYEERIIDATGNTFFLKRFNFGDITNGTTSTSSLLTSQLTQQYDGTSSHTDTATAFSYDGYGNVLTETRWGIVSGNTDGTFFDSGNDKRSLESTYTNDVSNYIVGLPVSKTLKNNSGAQEARTNYRYDVIGNQLEEGKWISGINFATTTNTYNSLGLVITETDPLNSTTTYSYDAYNLYPATVTNALGQGTTYTYDYSSGKASTVTDANSKIIEYIYDGLDRLDEETQTLSNGAVSTVRLRGYATTGTPQFVVEYLYQNATTYHTTRKYLDGFGREIQKKSQYSGGWATVDTVYDKMGQVQKVSIPYNTTSYLKSAVTTLSPFLTTNTFDPLGRILVTTDVLGVTTMTYSGLITTVTDALTHQKEYTDDAFNNLVQVKEYNGANVYTTSYGYNALDLLTNVTDADTNTRTVTYDGLGRRTALQDLHTASDSTYGTWSFVYNKKNLTSTTDPLGTTTSYTYDALSRVLIEDSNATAGTDILYSYDSCTNGVGYLCVATSSGAVTKFTYYKQGLENTKSVTIDGTSYTSTTTYNSQNQPLTIQYPNSILLSYGYNIEGLPSSVLRNSVIVASSTYGVHGKPLTISQANGVISTLTYNGSRLYELIRKLTQVGTSTKLQDLNYVYNAVGNITKITDNSNSNTAKLQTFGYDDLYRLITTTATSTANGQNYNQAFTYSPVGNITSFGGVTMTYTDLGFTNPHAVTNVGGQAYSYDKNGSLTTDGVWNHTWDYRNRLVSSQKGTTSVSYTYNQDGARVKLIEGSTTTIYPIDGYEIKNNVPKVYISLGNITIATIENASTTYVHTDHLGGTTLTTNASGTITQILDYFPYGATRIDSGTVKETDQYTGYKKDYSTGLSYAGARYYNSANGRFISIDPKFLEINDVDLLMDPQQMNSYSYGRNNPLKYIDPNGEKVAEFQPYPTLGSFGYADLMGTYRGTNLYSGGQYTGTAKNQYQCPDLPDRFASNQYKVNLSGTGNGVDYGNQTKIDRSFTANNPSNPGRYSVYSNGGNVMPQENDIISWTGGEYGHVGVIAEVYFNPETNSGMVYSLEQNFRRDQALFAQSFSRNSEGKYVISGRGSYSVKAWARYENQSKVPGGESYSKVPQTPAPKKTLSSS